MSEFLSSIPKDVLFKGRPGDPRLGEWVIPLRSAAELAPHLEAKRNAFVILGFPDDTGVRLNRGRAGAAGGPDSIRKHFYKMTAPMDFVWEEKISLFDLGNLVPATDIVETQKRAEALVSSIVAAGATVISLGGGHDFAAPSFMGFARATKAKFPKSTLGLTNVDPHLDTRELENGKPHSGTPFRQILESGIIKGQHFVEFGVRPNRNARSYFEYCKKNKVTVETLETILTKSQPSSLQFEKHLKKVAASCQALGATFDMDACSDAEGTSAAPVLGFSAWEMCKMAEAAGLNDKVKHFEIAEVAPLLDQEERSSRIAAEMIFFFLRAKAKSAKTRALPSKRAVRNRSSRT